MKKVKQHKGFGIYQRSQKELDKAVKENCLVSEYEIYLPDESPAFKRVIPKTIVQLNYIGENYHE